MYIYICKQPDRIRIGSVSVSDAGCFFSPQGSGVSIPSSEPTISRVLGSWGGRRRCWWLVVSIGKGQSLQLSSGNSTWLWKMTHQWQCFIRRMELAWKVIMNICKKCTVQIHQEIGIHRRDWWCKQPKMAVSSNICFHPTIVGCN